MLKRVGRWLRRIWRIFFQASPQPRPPRPEPSHLDYENCLMEVLAEARNGSVGRVKGVLISRGVTAEKLAEWMVGWGKEQSQNAQLAADLQQLGRIAEGKLGEVATQLGEQLTPPRTPTSTSTQTSPSSPRESTSNPAAKDAFDQGIEAIKSGQFETALAYFEQAITIDPTLDSPWNNKGSVLYQLQRYEEALEAYERAISLDPTYVYTWVSKGNLLNKLQRYEEALSAYERAISLDPTYAYPWNGKGVVLKNLQRYEEALEAYERAISLDPTYAYPWNGKGVMLKNLQRYEEALSAYDRALLLSQGQMWEAWANRGWALFSSECYSEAIKNWDQGLETYKSTNPDADLGYRKLHQQKGKAHYSQGKKSERERSTLWRKAVASFNAALQDLDWYDLPELALEVVRDLIRVRFNLGGAENRAVAEELARQATDLRRRIEADPQFSPFYKRQLLLKGAGIEQLTVDLALQAGELKQAFNLAEWGKAVCLRWLLLEQLDLTTPADSVEMLAQRLPPDTAAVYWHLSPAALTTFLLLPDRTLHPLSHIPSIPPNQSSFSNTWQRLEALESWQKDWDKHYDQMKEEEKSSPDSAHTDSAKGRSAWESQLQDTPQRLGNIVSRLEILSILEHYEQAHGTKINQLWLFPHRDLHRFPLHLCFPDHTCRYFPSISLAQPLSPTQPPLQSLVLIDNPHSTPQLDKAVFSLAELPYANVEAALIAAIMNSSPTWIQNPNATEKNVVAALTQPHQGLHFCGHGTHEPRDPACSRLFLEKEDRLDAHDIAALNLTGYRLVTLAACETAIARNATVTDEFVGLTSAFLYAGVSCVVSTLWTVASAATMLIMVEFYRQLQTGKPPAEALFAAQTWLRSARRTDLVAWLNHKMTLLPPSHSCFPDVETLRDRYLDESDKIRPALDPEYPYSHPYHWAAFICCGQ